jgi:hypothetical protein
LKGWEDVTGKYPKQSFLIGHADLAEFAGAGESQAFVVLTFGVDRLVILATSTTSIFKVA